MQTKSQVVSLSKDESSGRLVKSSALLFFKAVRYLAAAASEVPEVLSQAATDVQEAWRESSRPNV